MSGRQLARRMGVSPPTLTAMEKSEAAGTISVQTLRKAGEAMGVDFVYAFVPPESLEGIVRARANEVASRFYEGVNHTMALEAQSGSDRSQREQVAELADELVRTLSRDLWEDPHETDVPGRGHTP
jgi:predicted DNA-binding mobile mystery protein A